MPFVVGAASILVTGTHGAGAAWGVLGVPLPLLSPWAPGPWSVAHRPQRWQRRRELMSLCPHLTSLCAASGELGPLAPGQTSAQIGRDGERPRFMTLVPAPPPAPEPDGAS